MRKQLCVFIIGMMLATSFVGILVDHNRAERNMIVMNDGASTPGPVWSFPGTQPGPVIAWGDNSSGQSNVPSPNTDFIVIAAGDYHSLGLKSNGSIITWGDNYYGQCNVPEPNTNFIAVAGGHGHSLGLKSNGSIIAWGDNNYGQCKVPKPNTDFIAIAASGFHCLGLQGNRPPLIPQNRWDRNMDGLENPISISLRQQIQTRISSITNGIGEMETSVIG